MLPNAPRLFFTFAILLAPTLQAQTPYVWKHVTIKGNGFINGIVYQPAAKDVFYINTDMGGAYRWDTATNRWACMTDWASCDDVVVKHMGVESLAVDPTDAGRVFMSVGTYMQSTAMMRSRDGGRTWARTNVPFKSNGNGAGRQAGQRMNVDPNAPSILYYGTRIDGLWKSIDHGESWQRVESFPTIGFNQGWGRETGILFTQFDKTSSSAASPSRTIYVGVFEARKDLSRIYRSTDAGQSWQPLPGEQPTDANRFPQRCALTADGKTLFITYSSSTLCPGPWGVSDGRIERVEDPAGPQSQWTDVTPVHFKGGASAVTIHPRDPNTVLIAELGNYSPADRIWRSNDQGNSWTVMNPNAHRDDSSAAYAASSKVHWVGDVQIDPHNANVAMFTTGYGLYRTTDLSSAEPTWAFFNDGFEQTAVNELVSPADGPVHLISAIGDRDGYRHDDFDRSPVLGTLGSNEGLSRGGSGDIDIAITDPRRLVRVVNAKPYVQFSDDNAVTWHWMPDAGIEAKGGGKLALSADGNHVAWCPEGLKAAYRSTRTAAGWSAWTRTLTAEVRLTADPVEPLVFYGYAKTSSYRSTDGGATWTELTPDAPKNLAWIRAVPSHTGHLWAGGYEQTGLWRSTDGGAAWSRVDAEHITLAYCGGFGAAKSPRDYPSLFIGGKVNGVAGVLRSDDEGNTWTAVTDAEHQYGQLSTIQGDPRIYGRVYLGTNGRGIPYGDLRGGESARRN